jgi:hypothetical protein
LRDLVDCIVGIVLRTFNAGNKRAFPAGDNEADPLLGPSEGRHQFGAVLHGNPA